MRTVVASRCLALRPREPPLAVLCPHLLLVLPRSYPPVPLHPHLSAFLQMSVVSAVPVDPGSSISAIRMNVFLLVLVHTPNVSISDRSSGSV